MEGEETAGDIENRSNYTTKEKEGWKEGRRLQGDNFVKYAIQNIHGGAREETR